MKTKFTALQLCVCAVVAAIYVVVTLLTSSFAYGLAQFRLSDALVVLCWFEPVLGVGLTLGCFLANIFSTVSALDMVIGTLATALACLWTVKLKGEKAWLIPLPNVLVNALLVGGMLAWVLFPDNLLTGFVLAFAQVGFGELVVMYVLGLPLFLFAKRTNFLGKLLQR